MNLCNHVASNQMCLIATCTSCSHPFKIRIAGCPWTAKIRSFSCCKNFFTAAHFNCARDNTSRLQKVNFVLKNTCKILLQTAQLFRPSGSHQCSEAYAARFQNEYEYTHNLLHR